jgi:hypothetical protein
MDKKLTLKLNKDTIEKAKKYAKKRHQSLSKLVGNYFDYLSNSEEKEHLKFSALTKELSGIISLKKDFDLKKEYLKHIVDKYK